MTAIESLSLTSIDSMRHLTVSEGIVAAIVFASKRGYGVRTAYRFVTALVMTNALDDLYSWEDVFKRVTDLEEGI